MDDSVRQLWERWDAEGYFLCEVTKALHQYQKRGLISLPAVRSALKAAPTLPIQLYGEPDLHRCALNFAARQSLSATHDARYLALAEYLSADFWTTDRRLFELVGDELDWVHLVEA